MNEVNKKQQANNALIKKDEKNIWWIKTDW